MRDRIISTPLRVGKYDPKKVVVAADGYCVATVSEKMNDAEAHALLFASAPELFRSLSAALVEIDQELEQRKHGGNDEDWAALQALSDDAHAAIRKAEGR